MPDIPDLLGTVFFTLMLGGPFVILAWAAVYTGRSLAFVLLGFLSWLGVVIGLLLMFAIRRRAY